jgi:hypothetical protein
MVKQLKKHPLCQLTALNALIKSTPFFGAWRSLVARSVRDRKVGGSNPLAPTGN